VYNGQSLMDESVAASDPLHFKVMIDSAEVIGASLDVETKLGAQCTTVYLTSPLQPAPEVPPDSKPEDLPQTALEQWTPFDDSVAFCRTCGRVASDENSAVIWAECLHDHGLPQRLSQQPSVCHEMSAASELAATFAVRRLRTMTAGRAPRRRTKTVAQRREERTAAEAEAKRVRLNTNPLHWLEKVNEATRVSELDRVLSQVAETGLHWAGEEYSSSIWQQLALGHKDALHYLRATVNRMAEHGIKYEPPKDRLDTSRPDTRKADTPEQPPHSPPMSSPSSPEKDTNTTKQKTVDCSRASWPDFRRAVRNFAKVSYDELSDDVLSEIFAVAADEHGFIDRSEISQMLAMTNAATSLAKAQSSSVVEMSAQVEDRAAADASWTQEVTAPAVGKECLERLDGAARRLNLRYAFHVGALMYDEYTAAMERLDNIEDEQARESIIDHRLLSPGFSGSAQDKADELLPGVLSRLPDAAKAARSREQTTAVRDLADEWKQEMFNLTARKFWQPNPRLTVQQLSLALDHSGGDCDTRGWNAHTVLMCCAKTNFLEGALFLLHKGADRLLQNNRGWTALMLAAKYGHAEMCVALLTSAIPVEKNKRKEDTMRQRMLDQTASTGDTALEISLVNDAGACADLLAAYGAVVPRALKDAAARQAGSGGWLHLAAAAAAAGEASSEATTDARELEKIVQRSSLVALESGRSMQLAKQQELGRELYGTRQASGQIAPAVAPQGWGPSVAEKERYKSFSKQFDRDAEWVDMSGAAAPRAMHRKIALDKGLSVVALWGSTAGVSTEESKQAANHEPPPPPAPSRAIAKKALAKQDAQRQLGCPAGSKDGALMSSLGPTTPPVDAALVDSDAVAADDFETSTLAATGGSRRAEAEDGGASNAAAEHTDAHQSGANTAVADGKRADILAVQGTSRTPPAAKVRVPPTLREQVRRRQQPQARGGARPRTVSPIRTTRGTDAPSRPSKTGQARSMRPKLVSMRDQVAALAFSRPATVAHDERSLPPPTMRVGQRRGGPSPQARVPSMREQMAGLLTASGGGGAAVAELR
jgi:hypothetical protein